MIPKKVFFTSGVGRDKEKLLSFEKALRKAGIEKFNLVPVSSIFPPRCEVVTRKEGLKYLSPGQIVFCVLSVNSSNEPNKQIFASIGCAIPNDKNIHGYISEYHGFDKSKKDVESHVKYLSSYMLATTLGFKVGKKEDLAEFVKKKGIKELGFVELEKTKNNFWTTVIASAVFIP
ncbi:MAG: arginine decarboxylase, pyruvoyl-dependent [Candidatus Aenigmatarchaeota archaeon]